MKPFLGVLAAVSLFAAGVTPAARAQDYNYGTISELSGVLWIFVYTGDDLDARDNIIRNIQKELPFIRIASSPQEADAVLVFGSNAYSRYYGTYSTSNSSGNANCLGSATRTGNYVSSQANCQGASSTRSSAIPMYANVVDGKGWILKLVPNGKPRLISQYADTRRSILERRPSTNFARHFVKEYSQVNAQPPAPRPSPTVQTAAPDSAGISPERALFIDKARGTLDRLADSLRLLGEWRALLVRRAVPALENLYRIDTRASNADIADASLTAVGDVSRLLGVAMSRLAPLRGKLLRQLGPSPVDTLAAMVLFRDGGALFLEKSPNPTDAEIQQFIALCAEKFPGILAGAPNAPNKP